jgi:hypothetical protein
MKPLNVFVIQPFTVDYAETLYQWIENVCEESNGQFQASRADRAASVPEPRLQDRIDHYIKGSQICVADLITERNQNVLLEVGAAYALQIPVIPISNETLPSDISGNLYIRIDKKGLVEKTAKVDFKYHLKKRLIEASLQLETHHSTKFISHGYETRKDVDFYSLVQRAERRIWVLTTNLGFFVNEELKQAPGMHTSTLLKMIVAALPHKSPDFNLRILVLDPDSNFTNDRALALERDRREFREDLRLDVETVLDFVRSDYCKGIVQVKTYDSFPLQMTFFFDDFVVSSVVADGRSSRECITYSHSLAVRGGKDSYLRHFERLWAKGRLIAKNSSDERSRSWKPNNQKG